MELEKLRMHDCLDYIAPILTQQIRPRYNIRINVDTYYRCTRLPLYYRWRQLLQDVCLNMTLPHSLEHNTLATERRPEKRQLNKGRLHTCILVLAKCQNVDAAIYYYCYFENEMEWRLCSSLISYKYHGLWHICRACVAVPNKAWRLFPGIRVFAKNHNHNGTPSNSIFQGMIPWIAWKKGQQHTTTHICSKLTSFLNQFYGSLWLRVV